MARTGLPPLVAAFHPLFSLMHTAAVGMAALRERAFPLTPVMIATGIGIWFWWPQEPQTQHYMLAATITLACLLVRVYGPEGAHLPVLALGLCLAGFLAAGFRAHHVAAPVLGFRYYGPVEGRVTMIDRSYSDQIRLTLDHVVLNRMAPDHTPAQVRVALHGDAATAVPDPGDTVILTGHLSPPQGPVAPGGFDFRRLAWFERLGAVGYTRSPVLLLEPAPDGGLLWFRLRMRLSAAIQDRIGGQAGAMSAAFMTGDRSGIDATTNQAMRDSNLSHLISISGLHMGLLTGFVFGLLRYGMALVPPLALRVNSRKIAAGVALAAATFYLLLAGPDVATERAYVMAAVMLVAVLFDRRALSLWSVALAATLLLLLQPESLLNPGFQMSFSATLALVAGFEALRQPMAGLPRWARPVVIAVASSVIAGAATTPFAAAHFNRIAEYGLVANLIATPIMALVVMPAGVISALLGPVGLAGPALIVMGWGTALVLDLAHMVAGWEGAVLNVSGPGDWVLPLISAGGIWLAFWRGPLRLGGLLPMLAALWLWVGTERPLLLIAEDGSLVGLMGAEGRALSREKGAGFVADTWLEDDGDGADRATAYARAGFTGPPNARLFDVAGTPGLHLGGKAADAAVAACGTAKLIVVNAVVPEAARSPGCLLLDQTRLHATGAIAFYPDSSATGILPGLRMVTANGEGAGRLWHPAHRKQVQ
ncbi:MAG: ComEC/Rec2 family competence protein [Paracoccaceae bacterium]